MSTTEESKPESILDCKLREHADLFKEFRENGRLRILDREIFRSDDRLQLHYLHIRHACFPLEHDEEQFTLKDPSIRRIAFYAPPDADEPFVSCAEWLATDKKYGSIENVMTTPGRHREKGYARLVVGLLLKDAVQKSYSLAKLTCLEEHEKHYTPFGFEVQIRNA